MSAELAMDLSLVDYLAVIGFDKQAGLQIDPTAEAILELDNASVERSRAPLDRAYKSTILQVFPQNRPGFPFLSEVASLCMPKGLRFYTERKVPESRFHSFVLVKEDGSRVNGCAFTFYEPVFDSELRQQMFDLHLDYIKDVAESEAPDPNVRGRLQTDRAPPGQMHTGNHTLPRNVSRRNQSKRTSYYDSTTKPIFVAKCLCLIQRLPILFSAENILLALWSSVFNKQQEHTGPTNLIYWVLHDVPLPIPGTSLQCSYSGCDLAIRRPGICDLPFFDYPLYELFKIVPVDRFVKLFTCFLLEHQILLCSKRLDRLMLVGECLSALIFPFRWHLTYVPILPYAQLKFIEAPVPYLMGFCYEERIPDQIFQSNLCVLDIDSKRLDYPEDVPQFPKHRELVAQIEELIKEFNVEADSDPFGTSSLGTENALVLINDDTNGHAENPQPTTSPVRVVLRSNASSARRAQNANNRRGIVADSPTAEKWTYKRMSRSFDNHDSIEAAFRDAMENEEEELKDDEEHEENAKVAKQPIVQSEKIQRYLNCLVFNKAIRELFLHTFVTLFTSYDQFVLNRPTNADDEAASRDSVANFDCASFLSDQPNSSIPFLAAFLETQLFATFIDAKFLAQWKSEVDEAVALFDSRIGTAKQSLDVAKNRVSVLITTMNDFDVKNIPREQSSFSYEIPPPRDLHQQTTSKAQMETPLEFPDFDPLLFEPQSNELSSQQRQPSNQKAARLAAELDEQRLRMQLASPQKRSGIPKRRTPRITDSSQLAHKNLTFVEQLLKDTKVKTKRLLLMKMGKEALHLGHNDSNIHGVEENTLVAGLCDLLERVWSHGLKKKQGKSSFWSNVLSYYEKNKYDETSFINKNHSNVPPDTQNENIKTTDEYYEEEEDQQDKNALTDLLDQFRSIATNLDKAIDEDPDAPTWSTSLVRVANFLSDKIASNSTSTSETNVDDFCTLPRERGRQMQRSGGAPTTAPRSSSIVQSFRALGFRSNSINPTRENDTVPISTNQNKDEDVKRPNPISSRPPIPRDVNGNPMPPMGPRQMHKSSSVRDFAPQFINDQKLPPVSGATRTERADYRHLHAGSNPPTPTHQPHRTRRSQSRQPAKERKRSLSRPHSPSMDIDRDLPPLPTHISYDLRNVVRMTEIKTDMGFARAFIRLALERKLLHSHLRTILNDRQLLRELYKKYAFLRSEDEREQFIFHVMSLNAVDFSCFTHTFVSTRVQYEVLFVSTLDRFNSASVWITCSGSLATTNTIKLPPNSLQFTFEHKNLGTLTTLRIGHSVREKTSKWFLDYVIVRNNITAQAFRFNCGKSFGRSVEDGALERVLVAELIRRDPVHNSTDDDSPTTPFHQSNMVSKLMSSSVILNQLTNGGSSTLSRPQSPANSTVSDAGGRHRSGHRRHHNPNQHQHQSSRNHQNDHRSGSQQPQYNYYSARSQSSSRQPGGRSSSVQKPDGQPMLSTWDLRVNDLQHRIGEAVNALVKHLIQQQSYHSSNATCSLTQLLCGEKGLVGYVEQVFMLGRKDSIFSNRFFRQSYPWDYIEKSFHWFSKLMPTPAGQQIHKDHRVIIGYGYEMVLKISSKMSVGKEGKFQAFLLLALRDHQLPALLQILAYTPITNEIYDENSILRQEHQLTALSRLLGALNEFEFPLEKSLIYGIEF